MKTLLTIMAIAAVTSGAKPTASKQLNSAATHAIQKAATCLIY